MKKLFITIVSLLFFAMYGVAQDCYSDNRSKGVSAYNSGKYAEAKKYFQSAQNCDMKPKQNDLASWIGKCDERLKQTQSTTIQGELNGVFSVSPTKKVHFSQGNLQYRASTNTWRFAEHQYDIIGEANKNISSTYSGWIDLFGWGTSGWNSGVKAYQPYDTSSNDMDYYPFPNHDVEWGQKINISNGGNKVAVWRTLTYYEWNYLIKERTDASKKQGLACVNGVNGLVLLPDRWLIPSGLSFSSGISGFYTNKYSASEWQKMEDNGAVFFPASGFRRGNIVYKVGITGTYWSCTNLGKYEPWQAMELWFDEKEVTAHGSDSCGDGNSVRLVRNVK